MTLASLVAALAMIFSSLVSGSVRIGGIEMTVDLPPGISGLVSSSNVSYHGTIPIDLPAVGGQVVERPDLDGRRYFYVTGVKGLSIYEVTNPALPVLVGFLPLPHWQNEDLKVSDDGKRAVIAVDGSLGGPDIPLTRGIHVIDTSRPSAPRVVASSGDVLVLEGLGEGVPEHTAECADPECLFIYGRTGRIYDATGPKVREIGRWNGFEEVDAETGEVTRKQATGIHALNRDPSGLVISDSRPRLVLDPRDDPTNPVVLSIGHPDEADRHLQHNNVRPQATEWVPRDSEDDVELHTVDTDDLPDHNVSITDERPVMRPGEILIGASELNFNVACQTPSGLSTWSMVDFDKGAPMQQLEVFRPVPGNWLDSRPTVNVLGCSPHWFTVSDDVVAAGWYEHGTRFFRVDLTLGTIAEIGWFQPVWTSAGAAHWIDDEWVYSVDYVRGIDILRFDREAEPPDAQSLLSAWLRVSLPSALASLERLFCTLAAA